MSKIPDLLSFIEVNYKPDDNPPWYFILNDLKKSIAATIGIIFSLLFILIFSNRNYKGFYSLILFCIIFFGKSIGDGINILINTTIIFNAELAQTSWESQASYLSSPWNSYLYIVMLIIALMIFMPLKRKVNKRFVS